jgi:hypothetical protein
MRTVMVGACLSLAWLVSQASAVPREQPPSSARAKTAGLLYDRVEAVGTRLEERLELGDIPHANLAELGRRAPVIVIARVLGARSSLAANERQVDTEVAIRVLESVKGSIPAGPSCGLLQPAGNAHEAAISPVTLDRSACFGRCPDYQVSISGYGHVEYVGRGAVSVTGRHTGVVPASELSVLADAFRQVGFTAMRDQYTRREDGCPSVVTDGPTVVVLLEAPQGGQVLRKSIQHYHGCRTVGQHGYAYPHLLTALEDRIDTIIGSARWTGRQQDNVPLFLVFPGRDKWPER